MKQNSEGREVTNTQVIKIICLCRHQNDFQVIAPYAVACAVSQGQELLCGKSFLVIGDQLLGNGSFLLGSGLIF